MINNQLTTIRSIAKSAWEWLRQPANFLAAMLSLVPIYVVIVYMDTYARNVPANDHWLFGMDIATATKNGTLSLDVILRDFAGHRIFFTGALHALFAEFTNWNTIYEMWVNLPLAIGEFIVLILIFRRLYPQLTAWVLVPFSMLIFSTYQYLNWLNGFYTIWHFVPLFFLLAIYTLMRLKIGWLPVVLAAFFCFCATFSLGPGVVSWVAVAVGMVMLGYRRPLFYVFWGAVLLGTLYIYTREVQVQVGAESDGGFSSVRVHPPDQMLHFFFAFLGNPFVANFDDVLALRVAIIGLLLFGINLVFLWNTENRQLIRLAPWVAMTAFAGGVAALITLTRYNNFRWQVALEQRYTVISTYFWLALLAMFAVVIWKVMQSPQRKNWMQALVLINILFGVVLAGLYMRANIWNLQATAQRYGRHLIGQPLPDVDNEEDCLHQYPLTRDGTCIWDTYSVQLGNATPEKIYQIAAYGLTIFAEDDPVNILPDDYAQGNPVILDTPSRWLNVYVRDWLLDGVPAEDIFHIAPPEDEVSTDTYPTPLGDKVYEYGQDDVQAALGDFLGDARQVWVISTSETAEQASELDMALTGQNYVPLYIPIRLPGFEDADFKIVRYLRAPDETRDWLVFDENIHLKAWEVIEGETFNACDTVTVESWWTVDTTPDFNYSAMLFLTNAAGDTLASADGQLAEIEMGVWVPDLLFFDSRVLTIPCEIEAGDYTLEWRIYNYETQEELPFDEDGNTRGTMTELRVE